METPYAKDDFFAINEIFADMFNYAFWKNGVPNRVDHNDLYEMDGKQIIDVVNGRYVHRFQRERDVVRLWRLTVGDETIEIPLILGLELQDYIHYALPVKVMMYDALTYTDQVRKASKSKAQVELTDKEEIVITDPNEFLSGFPKDGVLIPPITITVYLGNECWDAPLAIRKMWSPALSKVPELRDMMMQNYKSFFCKHQRYQRPGISAIQNRAQSCPVVCKEQEEHERIGGSH